MRMRIAVAGFVSGANALAACGPAVGRSALSTAPARRDPVMLGIVPACTYSVVAQLEGRINHLGAQSPQGRDRHPVISQARSLGADAVMGFSSFPEFNANKQQVATNWKAIAIDFSDPEDPDCYR